MTTPIKYVSFDTETRRISYEEPVPALMCATFSTVGENKGSIHTPWEHPIDAILRKHWLEGNHTICHNTPFDLSIIAFKYPDMLPYIFKALDDNLIHDTLIREKLLNLTRHGEIDILEHNGSIMRISYAQAALEKKYLNIDRSALKDDDDSPRLNYSIYENVPLSQWKEEWISYAVDDAINCGLIFQAQEIEREKCISETGYDPFITESFRNRAAFALRLLECVGTLLDGEMVEKVAAEFRTEYNSPRLRDPLLKAGLLLPEVPPQPYANGAIDHLPTCPGHKDHPEYKKGRKYRLGEDCQCPPKMKAAEPEKSPTRPLFARIWSLARTNPDIKAWPSDSTVSDLKHAGLYEKYISNGAFKMSALQLTDITNEIEKTKKEIKRVWGLIDFEERKIKQPEGAPFTEEYKNKIFPKKALLKQLETYGFNLVKMQSEGIVAVLPDDITLKTDAEWCANFSALDPILSIWDERKQLRKIVTDYLPKLYITDPATGKETPAKIIRAAYGTLKKTGRSSSFTSKLYPSRNDQNVDPRVRPCTVPRAGNVLVSTDISGMELGTLAQTCYNLFGFSELRNKINNGIDVHAFLAAQIAYALDEDFQKVCHSQALRDKENISGLFQQAKGLKESCEQALLSFSKVYRHEHPEDFAKDPTKVVTFGDFFKHYRTMAKPTGLGYPGGLGAATFISYAKATFGLVLTLDVAKRLKEIWLETYPEMKLYLEHISKDCKDPNNLGDEYEDEDGVIQKRVWYYYDTPLGMHRPKCSFCDAANGKALQSPSAEGALDALYEVQKAVWLTGVSIPGVYVDPYSGLLDGVWVDAFIHDEILWEQLEDALMGKRARIIEGIIVSSMEKITPDVKAGAETAAMRRWFKQAESIWKNKNTPEEELLVWEEKKTA